MYYILIKTGSILFTWLRLCFNEVTPKWFYKRIRNDSVECGVDSKQVPITSLWDIRKPAWPRIRFWWTPRQIGLDYDVAPSKIAVCCWFWQGGTISTTPVTQMKICVPWDSCHYSNKCLRSIKNNYSHFQFRPFISK